MIRALCWDIFSILEYQDARRCVHPLEVTAMVWLIIEPYMLEHFRSTSSRSSGSTHWFLRNSTWPSLFRWGRTALGQRRGVQRRRSGDSRDWWQLPVASVPPSLDRVRVWTVGTVAAANLVKKAASPHFLFIGLRDGGPPTSSWTGRSRSERESKAQLAVGPTGGDQPNILPLDLIFYF